ncbi:DUF4132 domain-containing protein, partial [Actinomadura rubrisoli]
MSLPSVLIDPPWTGRKAAEPVVEGLKPPAGAVEVWEPGEREEWAGEPVAPIDWDDAIQQHQNGTLWRPTQFTLFREGPEERVRPLLTDWKPDLRYGQSRMEPVVARFGLDALEPALHTAKAHPEKAGAALLPFLEARVARVVAGWLAGKDATRELARVWLTRHGVAAVPYLVPDALGAREPARAKAAMALRVIAAQRSPEAVAEAAHPHGAEVSSLVADVPRVDPADPWAVSLVDPPRLGDWLAPALPSVPLRDGGVLPPEGAGHIAMMLALSAREEYPGLAQVRAACDAASLADFGWTVFEAWQAAGAPPGDVWALTGLGLLGDDTTVRRLTPVVRAWPGRGMHHRAVQGLDVLAAIGTDVALAHLDGIAQKVKYKALQSEAQDKIAQVAARLGLTDEQLADRLVPHLGLDGSGALVLDYGPRRFTVGFDEQLKPYVTDQDGKLRKSLPKPGAKDDPSLAPAAHQRFADMKKQVRAVASLQIGRLESAMLRGRRWTAAEFDEYLARHPLMWHIARRVVWTSGGTALRLAEDRTLADVNDETVTLPAAAPIGIPHPLRLGDDLDAWKRVFADYE